MKFKVGDQVRINAGQMYGQVGRVMNESAYPQKLAVQIGGTIVHVAPCDLIDSHANNGD